MAVSSAAPARMQILIGASWPQYVIGQSDPESRTMMRIPQSSPQLVAPAAYQDMKRRLSRLSSDEARLSLLAERSDALPLVGAAAEAGKAAALQRQAVGQRQLVGGEHRLLGEPERQRRLLGDAGGELECPADGLGGRGQLGRQARGDRLGRRERLAGKDQLHRQRLADQARQQ